MMNEAVGLSMLAASLVRLSSNKAPCCQCAERCCRCIPGWPRAMEHKGCVHTGQWDSALVPGHGCGVGGSWPVGSEGQLVALGTLRALPEPQFPSLRNGTKDHCQQEVKSISISDKSGRRFYLR